MPRIALNPFAVLVLSIVLVVAAVYALNSWWWMYAAPKSYMSAINLTESDTLFLEGLLLVIFGLLFMLGRGGINLWSIRAALLGSLADFLYGRRRRTAPGPAEILRRDAWKPSGFALFALALIFAGVILIALYFLL